jgi:VanZ family protein
VRNFLKYNRWAILWALLIIVITLVPGEVLPRIPSFLDLFKPDKILHVIIFGLYVLLQIRGMARQYSLPPGHKIIVLGSLVAGLTLAAGTELLQSYLIPGRNGSVFDFIANSAGCIAGGWVSHRFSLKWL